MNTITNRLVPRFTDEQLEADRAIRADAQTWPADKRRVYPGTAQFEVIARHWPSFATFVQAEPTLLYEVLTSTDPIENPFETECPEWCTQVGAHADDVVTATGQRTTNHSADILYTSDKSLGFGLVRDDVLLEDGTVESRKYIAVYGEESGEVDVAGLRDIAATATRTAAMWAEML